MKPYNFEDRLVVFVGDIVQFLRTLPKDDIGPYYRDQLLRASGSAALHYGEAQGTDTAKDFIHKVTGTVKELMECRVILKILITISYGTDNQLKPILIELGELIKIANTMVLNKKQK